MGKKEFKSLNRFRLHHKILFSITGIIGAVLIWKGIWALTDKAPLLNNPVVSVILGLVLVVISGVFFKLL